MITSTVNYLELFMLTLADKKIPMTLDFFNQLAIKSYMTKVGIPKQRQESLLYSLRVAKDEIRRDEDAYSIYLSAQKYVIAGLDRYQVATNAEQRNIALNDIITQIEFSLESLVAPISYDCTIEMQWPAEITTGKQEIIKSIAISYAKFMISGWRENLSYEFDDEAKDMKYTILELLENEIESSNHYLLSRENVATYPIVDKYNIFARRKDDVEKEKGSGLTVTIDVSKKINADLNQLAIADLKRDLSRFGLAKRSVPLFFKLMGYYAGVNKNHVSGVTMTKTVDASSVSVKKSKTKKLTRSIFRDRKHGKAVNDKHLPKGGKIKV